MKILLYVLQNCIARFHLCIFVLSVISFSACSKSIFRDVLYDDVYGGTLNLSTSSDPKTFNPILAQETSSTQILHFVFEGLTTIDPRTGDVFPCLALSWEHDDEGLIWRVRLRNDILWSDGTPFTAHDVVFTFQDIIYNPDVLTGLKSLLFINGEPISVSAIDDFTLDFKLPYKFAPFMRTLSLPILPKHVLSGSVEKGTFNEEWGIDAEPREIVGTGPFMIETFYPGERVILKRNPHYWKKDSAGRSLPYLSRIVLAHIQSPDMALLKFKNKEIDLYGVSGADYPWLKRLEEKTGDFLIYNLGPTMGSSFLAFNQNRGLNPNTEKAFIDSYKLECFSDLSFRQAIAHAINKQAIIDLVFNGFAVPQESVMSPASGFFYTSNVRMYDYDPQRAADILESAGYKDIDGDTIREDSNGHSLKINFLVGSGSSQSVQLANLIRKDLSLIGIHTNLMQLEFNTLVSKLTYSYDWEMVMIGLTGGVEPHFGSNVWLSSSPLHIWNPRQTAPASEWERRVDEIFASAVIEINDDKRKALYDEWQMLVSENIPVLYTVIPVQLYAASNRIGHLDPTPLGGLLHNVEELYIKR